MARAIIVTRYAKIPRTHEWYRSANTLNEAKFLASPHPSETIFIIKTGDYYSMYRAKDDLKRKGKG